MSLSIYLEGKVMVDSVHFEANITHNLTEMAEVAGIYQALWRPEELGITKAWQLIDLLEAGLAKLLAEPDKFKALNPSNGWGDYDGLVDVVTKYLAACKRYPKLKIRIWR